MKMRVMPLYAAFAMMLVLSGCDGESASAPAASGPQTDTRDTGKQAAAAAADASQGALGWEDPASASGTAQAALDASRGVESAGRHDSSEAAVEKPPGGDTPAEVSAARVGSPSDISGDPTPAAEGRKSVQDTRGTGKAAVEYSDFISTMAQYNHQVSACQESLFQNGSCVAQSDPVLNTALNHLVNAVRLGDVRAARELQTNSNVTDKVWDACAEQIVKIADASLGQKSDRARIFLQLAGDIERDGRSVPRNYDKATLYFAGSWVAGESASAGLAANTYFSSHDLVNTYLWALRCDSDCRKADTLSVSVSDLESELDGPSMKLVQSKVTDRSVMGL